MLAKTSILLPSLLLAAVTSACVTTYTVPREPCHCPTRTLHTATSYTDCHGCSVLTTSTHTAVPTVCRYACVGPTPVDSGTTTVVSCSATDTNPTPDKRACLFEGDGVGSKGGEIGC